MPLQVVYSHQRQACAKRNPFGCVHPNDQRTGQARAARGSHRVDVFQGEMGFGKRFFNDRQDGQNVLA